MVSADAANQFFGPDVAKLVRDESIASVDRARMFLTAAQKGALGQSVYG